MSFEALQNLARSIAGQGYSAMDLYPRSHHPRNLRKCISEFLAFYQDASLESEDYDPWCDYHDSRSYDKYCHCDDSEASENCDCFSSSDEDDLDLAGRRFVLRWHKDDMKPVDVVDLEMKMPPLNDFETYPIAMPLHLIMEDFRQTAKPAVRRAYEEMVRSYIPHKIYQDLIRGYDVPFDYTGPYRLLCQDDLGLYSIPECFRKTAMDERWALAEEPALKKRVAKLGFWVQSSPAGFVFHANECDHKRPED